MTIHSFDVFDTCLIRNVAVPSDIFLFVAESFEGLLVPTLGSDYRLAFRNCRVRAEDMARTKSLREEVTLEEIWTELVLKLPMIEKDAGMRAELAAEGAALKPNRIILDRVKELADTGARVIFVSDIYLSSVQVMTFLRNAGFPAVEDNVYTSGDVGLMKATGSLFHHVLAQEQCLARNLVHTGDNERADVEIPRRLGVKVRHVKETQLNRYELTLLKHTNLQDMMFVSRMVGEMRRLRLDGLGTESEAAHDIVAAFIGPVLFLFANWLAGRARAQNIERLYFTSRDCYFLRRMALQMPQHFSGIDCRYFYSSRQALHLPSLLNVTPEGIRNITYPGDPKTVNQFLEKFELRRADVSNEIADFLQSTEINNNLMRPQDEEKIIFWLCQHPVRTYILEKSAKYRRAALAYFEQERLLDSGRFAIVDLGWRLTTQASLSALLKHVDPAISVQGFYFGLGKPFVGFSESGPVEALIHHSPIDVMRNTFATPFAHAALLEAILSGAPHGSVLRYDFGEDGQPIPVCADVNESSQSEKTKLMALCEIFAKRLDEDLNRNTCTNTATLADQLLRAALINPAKIWIRAVGGIRVSTGTSLRESCTVQLNQPYRWRKVFSGNRSRHPWPALSLSEADPALRLTVYIGRFLKYCAKVALQKSYHLRKVIDYHRRAIYRK